MISCSNYKRFFAAFVGLLLLSSCEEVIDLDLPGAEKKYVVEALLTNQAGGCKVLLSQTKDFDEDNSRITVSGAQVSIRSEDTTLILPESSPGTYTDASFHGAPGNTYYLTVQIGEETITSTSTMPSLVKMDRLSITREFFVDDYQNQPTIDYIDPEDEENNYRFVLYVNGVKKHQLFVMNDELTNGNHNSTRLFVDEEDLDDEEKIKSGDIVRVEMQTIDKAVYRYFFSLDNSATGENNAATPANPVSNLQGNALGYFSAYTTQEKEVRVP